MLFLLRRYPPENPRETCRILERDFFQRARKTELFLVLLQLLPALVQAIGNALAGNALLLGNFPEGQIVIEIEVGNLPPVPG